MTTTGPRSNDAAGAPLFPSTDLERVELADLAAALVPDHWDPADVDRDALIDPSHHGFTTYLRSHP